MALVQIRPDTRGCVAEAQTALRDAGLVLLRGVVDREFLRFLRARMDRDTQRLLAFCDTLGGNPRDAGQLQQGPPTFPPYLHRDLLANPLVWEIATGLLGSRAGLMFYNGNTNCPGSQSQHVHIDQPHPNTAQRPMSALVVSIPVQDISTRNGSLEVWPGTQWLASPPRVPSSLLARRLAVCGPLQPEVRAGDLLLRDARVWHRGVTNPSSEVRHLIGAVIHAEPRARVAFDFSARPFVESCGAPLNPVYSDQREEYLFGPTRWLHAVRTGQASTATAQNGETTRPLAEI